MANKKGNVVKSAETYQREEMSSDKKPVSHGQLAEFIKIQNRNLQDFVSETKENKREEQEQDEDMDTDEDDSDECDDDGERGAPRQCLRPAPIRVRMLR